MKIAVISDLHGYLPKYQFENVEVLLICGDIIPLNIQSNMPASKTWFDTTFRSWAESLNVEKIIFIAGNHDISIERDRNWFKTKFSKYSKIAFLDNELCEYLSTQDGKTYSIFGTPYCKQFGNWAFMRNPETLVKKYSSIPENLDILITHDAPMLCGIGFIHHQDVSWGNQEAGNKILADVILNKKPKYVFSGHIHSGQHELQECDGIKLANTSIVDEKYNVYYKPLILDI